LRCHIRDSTHSLPCRATPYTYWRHIRRGDEKGDQEFTFDEMWAVDLNKLDGVREIYRRGMERWDAVEEESEMKTTMKTKAVTTNQRETRTTQRPFDRQRLSHSVNSGNVS